jgi:hypothetical protein
MEFIDFKYLIIFMLLHSTLVLASLWTMFTFQKRRAVKFDGSNSFREF